MRTIFPQDNGESASVPKETPNISAELGSEREQDVKFPKRLRNNGKGKVLATIYKRPEHSPYRLYWRAKVDGKPKSWMKDFATYSEAKRAGDKVVKDLAKGSQATALSPGQVSSALAAIERLQRHYQATGNRLSLFSGIEQCCDAVEKLNGRSLAEAVDGFLSTLTTVKRENVADLVEKFITAEEPRTKASEGKRPDLSPKYHYNRAIMLRRFAASFPGTHVCDLAKAHMDTFFASLNKIPSKSRNKRVVASAKSRNHHRAAIRQFLSWAVRNDYLAANNRLGEADGFRPENGNTSEIEFYTPAEFNALLEAAEGPMRAIIAIGGLAGLRTSELLRLSWEDTRKVENHIEVTSSKAKTRQRRLVELAPSLAQWLAPYAKFTGEIWSGHEVTFQQHFSDLCEKARAEVKGNKFPVARKPNGLRHSFCTFHFALYGNENLTAQQAGNSPAMLHRNYKGLATRKEGQSWFAVAPARTENVIPFKSTATP